MTVSQKAKLDLKINKFYTKGYCFKIMNIDFNCFLGVVV